MTELIRDGTWWQALGTIIAGVALVLTLVLEWPKVKVRLIENPRIGHALRGAVSGTISAGLCGALTGIVGILIYARIYPALKTDVSLNYGVLPKIIYSYATGNASVWAIGGAIVGIIFGAWVNPLVSSLRERLLGSVIGMMLGFFLGGVFATIQAREWNSILWISFSVSFAAGGGAGGLVLGALMGSAVKRVIQFLYAF